MSQNKTDKFQVECLQQNVVKVLQDANQLTFDPTVILVVLEIILGYLADCLSPQRALALLRKPNSVLSRVFVRKAIRQANRQYDYNLSGDDCRCLQAAIVQQVAVLDEAAMKDLEEIVTEVSQYSIF